MIPFLVSRIRDLEFILTGTEKEALILENNLIKEHRPRYNVDFRDDKSYYNIRIDPSEPFPRFQLVRRPKKDGARYFGPYPSGAAAKETLRFLQTILPLRSCRDRELKAPPPPLPRIRDRALRRPLRRPDRARRLSAPREGRHRLSRRPGKGADRRPPRPDERGGGGAPFRGGGRAAGPDRGHRGDPRTAADRLHDRPEPGCLRPLPGGGSDADRAPLRPRRPDDRPEDLSADPPPGGDRRDPLLPADAVLRRRRGYPG